MKPGIHTFLRQSAKWTKAFVDRLITGKTSISPLFIAILLGCVFVYITAISEGVQYSGDGIQHFLIAKHAWSHPRLLIDHWGKPLFTLLSSPFAQIGFVGMVLFNTLLFIITTQYLSKISTHFGLKHVWLIPLLLFLSPAYFNTVIGGMTEILFGTVLIVSVYYLLKGKYAVATILFSFIIFTRPEGTVVFPFITLYVLLKSPKHLGLLATGFLTYSLAGWAHYDNFFWVIENSPYTGASDIYGSGGLFHFINMYYEIIELPIAIVLLIGVGIFLSDSIKSLLKDSTKEHSRQQLDIALILVFPMLSVVAVHSYIWWQGLKGSFGLVRVMATIVPPVAFIVLYGINRSIPMIFSGQNKPKTQFPTGLVLILVLYISSCFIYWKARVNIPVPLQGIEKQLNQAGWWHQQQLQSGLTAYAHPYFAYAAEIDPFDDQRSKVLYAINKNRPSEGLNEGDLLVWDAHFGNEKQLPFQAFANDPDLKLQKAFVPSIKTDFNPERPRGVYVFKVDKTASQSGEVAKYTWHPVKNTAITIPSTTEYFKFVLDTIATKSSAYFTVHVQADIFFPADYSAGDLHVVIEQKSNERKNYVAEPIDHIQPGSWNAIELKRNINSTEPVFFMYLWNPGRKEYTIRNCVVHLQGRSTVPTKDA